MNQIEFNWIEEIDIGEAVCIFPTTEGFAIIPALTGQGYKEIK